MLIKNKKVLILTGSFGNGHISVTNSIINQFNRMNVPQLTVIQHDLFLEAHPILTSIAKKYYLNTYKYFRNSYKKFYYANPDDIDKCFYKYYGLNRLINILMKEKPDLILLTFPTPVVSIITKDLGINIPVVTVITDYTYHKNWITPNSMRYYVATEETAMQLSELNIDDSEIHVTGIPIHEKFSEPVNTNDWLTAHHLNPSKKTLLMVAGAFGVVEGFRSMLEVMVAESNHQFVVVCGSNSSLKAELTALFKDNHRVLVLGYTNEMHQWMSACHLMLTKPGGITITEALSKQIPLIFFNPAPGQEGENAVYFSRKGFGRITHTYDETTHVVLDILNSDKELNMLKNAMMMNYKPDAAGKICTDIIDLLNESIISDEIASKASLYAKFIAK